MYGPIFFAGIIWSRVRMLVNRYDQGSNQGMTTRQQRVLAFGISIGVLLASLGWIAVRPAMFAASVDSHPHLGAQISEEQRLHDMALRDLKETQDEVAKMKAHGIGMHPTASAKSGY